MDSVRLMSIAIALILRQMIVDTIRRRTNEYSHGVCQSPHFEFDLLHVCNFYRGHGSLHHLHIFKCTFCHTGHHDTFTQFENISNHDW